MNNQTESSQNILLVGDQYRTNPLSLEPGGVTVRVHYSNGAIRVYDKIKNVIAYTKYMKGKFEVESVEPINFHN